MVRHMNSTHRGSFLAGGWFWYVGLILLASAVASVVKGEWAMGGLSLLIGVGLLVMPVLRWKQTLLITDAGFTWTRLTGVEEVSRDKLRKVTLIHHRSRNGSYEELEVELSDGRTLGITGVERAEEAANLLHAFTRGPAAPPAKVASGWKAPGAAS